MALVVVVVAAAQVQEIAGVADRLPLRADFRLDGPARLLGRPRRGSHPVLEADVAVDAELLGGLAQIVQDGRPVRNGPGSPSRA